MRVILLKVFRLKMLSRMSLDFTARKTCIERMKNCGAFVRLVGGIRSNITGVL